MHASPKLYDFLRRWEAIRTRVYLDSAGLATVGIGHLITEDDPEAELEVDNEISMARVEELFRQDVAIAESAVLKLLPVPVAQSVFDALVAWMFNVGETKAKTSRLWGQLKAGRFEAAKTTLQAWNKITDPETKKLVVSRGLVRRRKAEAVLWG